jgi:exodeoxyribonuclease V alpha subunit
MEPSLQPVWCWRLHIEDIPHPHLHKSKIEPKNMQPPVRLEDAPRESANKHKTAHFLIFMHLTLQFVRVVRSSKNNKHWGILEFHHENKPTHVLQIKASTWPWDVVGLNGSPSFQVQLEARRGKAAGDPLELQQFHPTVESLTIPTLTQRRTMTPRAAQSLFAKLGASTLHTLNQVCHGKEDMESLVVPSIFPKTSVRKLVEKTSKEVLPSLVFRVALVARHADMSRFLSDNDVDFMQNMFHHEDTDETDPDAFILSIQKDPVILFWGVGRKKGLSEIRVRSLADKLNIPPSAPSRIHMEIVVAMREGLNEGHMYTEADQLCRQVSRTGGQLHVSTIKECLESCPCINFVEHPTSRRTCLVLSHVARMEAQVVAKLRALNKPSTLVLDIPEDAFDGLHEAQAEALRTMIRSNLAVISGSAGTGKTTLVSRFVDVLKANRVKFVGVAPTGKAALTLSEKTGIHCRTIHGSQLGGVGDLGPTVIVIDEASMVHVPMAWMVLKHISNNMPVMFVGDVNQLPPVMVGGEGYGFLFDILLRSCPTTPGVKLSHVYRQDPEAGGSILDVANAILTPTLTTRDFASRPGFTARATDRSTIVQGVIQVLKDWGEADKGMDHPVICQTNGVTQQINYAVQELINPLESGEHEVSVRIPAKGFPFWKFREGDPVICIKNITNKTTLSEEECEGGDETVLEMLRGEKFEREAPTYLVFANGSKGIVSQITRTGDPVIVFGEHEYVWPHRLINQFIMPAYSMTIHKAQGSEWERGIVVIENLPKFQFRSSVYTGITRFKKECVLFGIKSSMEACVKAPQNPSFRTFMVESLNFKKS